MGRCHDIQESTGSREARDTASFNASSLMREGHSLGLFDQIRTSQPASAGSGDSLDIPPLPGFNNHLFGPTGLSDLAQSNGHDGSSQLGQGSPFSHFSQFDQLLQHHHGHHHHHHDHHDHHQRSAATTGDSGAPAQSGSAAGNDTTSVPIGSDSSGSTVQGQTGSDGGSVAAQPGWDVGGTSATSQPGSDAGSSTTWSQPGSDTGSSYPPTGTAGTDTPAPATVTPGASPGSDSGSGTGTTPPAEIPPVAGAQGTPTDAASALAGFQMPALSGNTIEPQFGNGKSDTQAIQDAVNQAAANGGGVVHIPAGTYNIDAANDGIVMKSNVSLVMDKGATLKAIPNGAESGCIIDVRNANNVNIYGGKLVGDFGPGASHSGETMSGIDVLGSSSNIDIQGVESDANKGDGFDISGSGDNIHIAHCVAQGNKRDGLSIEGGSHILIENNAFINTGTADSYDNEVPAASRLPNSGIDIENSPGQSVDGAIVRNNLLAGNGTPSIDANTSNGWGIRVTGSDGNNSQVIDNTVVGNAAGGIGVWSGSGNIVSGNTIENQPNPYSIFGGSASGDGNTNDGVPVGASQG